MGTDSTSSGQMHAIYVPEVVRQDREMFRIYMIQYTLLDMRLQLEEARKRAGFTEEELAHKLHWQVKKIRQFEGKFDAPVTLEDYVRWLAACGVLPTLSDPVALDDMRNHCCQVRDRTPVEERGDDS